MLDFLMISTRSKKQGVVEIYPKFIIKRSSDLMIRGGDFYAIWIEEKKLWSTDEQDALRLIDHELDIFHKENAGRFDGAVRVLHMWDSESGMIDAWHKYCQKQMRDHFVMLDEKLIFSNVDTKKEDYASKRLPYPLDGCDIPAYDKLMSVLYSAEERHKIEWAIGSIVTGDSKKLQKFMVLYGAAGTGKSTVLNIVQQLFEGYHSVFDAKALGSSNSAFALEAFRSNPLVAIQHDGDLSRLEDNTRLNSLVSHELMTVNEKFKATYASRFKCFLFMGTNKPVRITDGRSGLIRRLIDVSPTGDKLSPSEYKRLTNKISFELGGIAQHCKDVYLENPGAYDNYIPVSMMSASNDFYNFVVDSYSIFKRDDGVSLKASYEMYKTYCDDAKVQYPFTKRVFVEEMKNYFREYETRHTLKDGTRVRSYFVGFRSEKFDDVCDEEAEEPDISLIDFSSTESIFDKECADFAAQYASEKETPQKKWSDVTTVLRDLDTTILHYVKLPLNHIVIDFDLKDEAGSKSYELNLREASKWPATYAELSKGGAGIHLHYIYTGNPEELSCLYKEGVEVKVFKGNSSLRRRLSKCNNLPIATISSGLPLKGDKPKMINATTIKSERSLRLQLRKNLNKEIHPNTKPSMDFIKKILDDAYASGLHYDVTDMRPAIFSFAAGSTNQAEACIKMIGEMKFKSEEASQPEESEKDYLIFFDTEIFPNLFLLNWKRAGEGHKVVRLINPTPVEIEELIQHRLVGFNNRRYDNHILYARLMGYTNQQLYEVSTKIINGSRNAFFGEAYNLSYTDVYDFCSKKQGLKKWEIELGIHHQELGLPWDQPVPEKLWHKVAEYCDNDVLATEAVFNARQADFTARKVLADVADMTVNDTTNSLTTKIIFGNERKPQSQFNYRNMGDESDAFEGLPFGETISVDYAYTLFDSKKRPVFPGYKYEYGKSTYRGEEVGEGGYVYAEPGMYTDVALLDIASMHPSSIVAENLFGPYTQRFKDILDARIAIKHGDFEKAKTMLGGKLAKYLDDESKAADLAQALKIAINSVYGLTSAKFENPFRDERNIDNIVAKRGALFMVNLKHEVRNRGFTVAHIKTDSIKIPNATPEIIQFVTDYGKLYGYNFEHEATYDRMCLVNDAVYIAKYKGGKHDGEWTATGKQFQVPYVFKSLFSKEPIKFEDMCETKSVTSALYLRNNNPDLEEIIIDPETGMETTRKVGDKPEFVGRVGLFCPIKKGCGGKELLRECKDKDGNIKYASATGAKGYEWLEAEFVKNLHKEDDIDKSYYQKMVDEAKDAISKYGDFEWFVSDDSAEMDIPPWEGPSQFDVR